MHRQSIRFPLAEQPPEIVEALRGLVAHEGYVYFKDVAFAICDQMEGGFPINEAKLAQGALCRKFLRYLMERIDLAAKQAAPMSRAEKELWYYTKSQPVTETTKETEVI